MDLTSHKTQLLVAALAGSLATAGAITAYQSYSRSQKRRDIAREIHDVVSRSIPNTANDLKGNGTPKEAKGVDLSGSLEQWAIQRQLADAARDAKPEEYDEELVREQLARCYAVFKDEGMKKLRAGKVAVVGCGGVGSWAAVMLVRS